MKIFCEKNKGHQWTKTEQGCIRGYVQRDSDGVILRGIDAIAYFCHAETFNDFLNLLKEIDGCFSVIICKNGVAWAAVDVARSMPLYYAADGSIISDSSEKIRKELGIARDKVNSMRLLEFYEECYITHDNTIYDEIKQIELGEAAEFIGDTVTKQPYFKHIANVDNSITREHAKQCIEKLTDKMLNNLLKVIGNRQIVLSLSGGYDSRYLACSLKQHGVDNVICYTYGKKTSFEIQQSKKVADALGYKWYCAEYTDDDMKSFLDNSEDYFDYCNGHDFIVYFQNYLAVKKLHEQEVFPKNSVFLTGLCNDMPTGSYIPNEAVVLKYGFSAEGVAKYITDSRFVRKPITLKQRKFFVDEIVKYLDRLKIKVFGYQGFIQALDCVTTGYSHSRWFCHMNTVHEYFGYEWLLPCWDKKLLKFWYSLPVEMKVHQNLYEEYVTEGLAAQYGVGTKKIILKLSSKVYLSKLKRNLGGFLARIFYPLGIPIKRKTDHNNFSWLEVKLYKRIKNKGAIIYQRAAIILLLNIYLIEQRYGVGVLKKYCDCSRN